MDKLFQQNYRTYNQYNDEYPQACLWSPVVGYPPRWNTVTEKEFDQMQQAMSLSSRPPASAPRTTIAITDRNLLSLLRSSRPTMHCERLSQDFVMKRWATPFQT